LKDQEQMVQEQLYTRVSLVYPKHGLSKRQPSLASLGIQNALWFFGCFHIPSMPTNACFFNSPLPFHHLRECYRVFKDENLMNIGHISMTETFEDEAVLIEAAKLDPAAFEPLYQRYMTRIYRYLYLRIGNAEDAADLTQQVFLKVLHALPSYRIRGAPFAAWLFRIAHDTVSDVYRREKRAVSLSWDFFADDELLSTDVDPELLMLQQEQLTQLNHLLCQLDPSKLELLALRFSGGLSGAEIALVVGKSQAAVCNQLHDAERGY
jgi:RNA polymerase sigma-70 factor (ECF subfamily)